MHPPLSRLFYFFLLLYYLSSLIIVLKEEERIAEDRVRTYELDPTMGLNMRPRSRTYINNDAAIKQLIRLHGVIQHPTDQQVISHLRAIQYRLAKNGFDEWDN